MPSDPIKRKKWIDAIEKHQEFDFSICKYYVCQLHFPDDCIKKAGSRTNLLAGVVPTIFPQICNIEYLEEDADCVNKYINLHGDVLNDLNAYVQY